MVRPANMAVNALIRNRKFFLVSNLSETDVLNIWQIASKFIKTQMLQHKGVSIPGLGTFTFSEVRIPIGKDNCIMIHRPVFIFSEWFLQTHGLTCIKPCASGHIPVVALNYSMLAKDGTYSRDSVELCIKEILLAMSHYLFTRKSVQLDFCGVGRLFVKELRVKMKFFRDFIRKLDVDGKLENVFRPQSTKSDISVMTNPFPSRCTTTDNFLPRVASTGFTSSLTCPATPDRGKEDSGNDPPNSSSEAAITKKSIAKDQCDSDVKSHTLPKTVLVSSEKDHTIKLRNVVSAGNSRQNSSLNGAEKAECERPSSSHSLCSRDKGELCYFCHQRNKRNVFVDTTEEKKAREEQYEKILHEYQQKKHRLANARENDARTRAFQYAKDASKQNLESGLRKKSEKAKIPEYHPSYFLQDHAVPEAIKRKEYRAQLDSQTKRVQESLQKMKERKERIEKEEGRDLAKRLNMLEEAYLKEKAARAAEYRKALTDQIQAKYCDAEDAQMEDSIDTKHPVFGIHDSSLKDQKELNKALVMDHLALVRERDQKDKERVVNDKREEAEMLKRAKQEYVQELRASTKDKLLERRKLEESWATSQHEKHQHLLQEISTRNQPSILVLDQCEKYRRCQRCQRQRENRGESKFSRDI